jgi:lipopolysaccharide/colanic/teichoic acid biosynthesis glycosyltransferase
MLKRLIDISSSLMGLITLWPLLLWIGIRIKNEDGGPVFYRGERVGFRGKFFHIFKFRTMVADAEKLGASSTSDDDTRITRIGRFLRKYKLDELPQLINVFIGDMSIVGPRPQVQWAVDLYSPSEREILNVRPGITDLASLFFANEGEILKGSFDPDIDYLKKIHPEKIRLSLEYVRNQSLWGDMKIILRTILVVLRCSEVMAKHEKVSN